MSARLSSNGPVSFPSFLGPLPSPDFIPGRYPCAFPSWPRTLNLHQPKKIPSSAAPPNSRCNTPTSPHASPSSSAIESSDEESDVESTPSSTSSSPDKQQRRQKSAAARNPLLYSTIHKTSLSRTSVRLEELPVPLLTRQPLQPLLSEEYACALSQKRKRKYARQERRREQQAGRGAMLAIPEASS